MGAEGSRRETGSAAARRLDTGLLMRAYAAGLFPMADSRESQDVFWVEPRRRGVLPLDRFHLPRSLDRTLRREQFRHSRDLAFTAVIHACAEPAPGRPQSWINGQIIDAYGRLHAQGHAHSIECWDRDGQLVGGLYGVRLGAAFFGESMFSRTRDASKAALAHLVARLRIGGFRLLDTQFLTSHLERFGGIEVRRAQYLAILGDAQARAADWTALDLLLRSTYPASGGGAGAAGRFLGADLAAAGFGPSGKAIAQLLTQTS